MELVSSKCLKIENIYINLTLSTYEINIDKKNAKMIKYTNKKYINRIK